MGGLIAAAADSVPILWAGSALFGLSMASSFPSAMNLSQEYIAVTGRVQGFINVMACMGEVVIPVAAAYILEHSSSIALMVLVAVLSVASGLAIARVCYVGGRLHASGEKMGIVSIGVNHGNDNGLELAASSRTSDARI